MPLRAKDIVTIAGESSKRIALLLRRPMSAGRGGRTGRDRATRGTLSPTGILSSVRPREESESLCCEQRNSKTAVTRATTTTTSTTATPFSSRARGGRAREGQRPPGSRVTLFFVRPRSAPFPLRSARDGGIGRECPVCVRACACGGGKEISLPDYKRADVSSESPRRPRRRTGSLLLFVVSRI